jgi:tetratricopeptide (TPR) repeat protein
MAAPIPGAGADRHESCFGELMRTAMARSFFGLAILCCQLGSTRAWAQEDPKVSAREHYEKGRAAYNDARFSDALEEFEAAYRVSPAFAVLFSIGNVNVALGHPVEAVDAFEKYLAQGGSAIQPERRKDVLAEIERQRARFGTVVVRTQPDAADVRVDGKLVGEAPLAQPIRLGSGRHTVEAILAGYTTQARDIDVVGRGQIEIELRLEPVVAPESPKPEVAPVQAPVAPSVAPVPLDAQPAPPHAIPPVDYQQEARRDSGSGVRMLGYLVASLGVLGAATGSVIAVTALGQANGAKDRLSAASNAMPVTLATQASWDQASGDFNSAKNLNELGWTVAGIGVGVAVGGVILILASPEQKTSLNGTRIAPWITATSGGAAVEGAW